MKRFIFLTISMFLLVFAFAQSIGQSYYNATYRRNTGLKNNVSSRVARKLQAPVTLNGFLVVYTEDLGYFTHHPNEVIKQLNAQMKFGKNNWRIPTASELCIMEENADKLGLGSGIYMCTSHSNGILRLVAVDEKNIEEEKKYVKVGNTYWLTTNLGANNEQEVGSIVTSKATVTFCPAGCRLPTNKEYEELLVSGKAYFSKVSDNEYSAKLRFPICEVSTTSYVAVTYMSYGAYLIKDNDCYLFYKRWQVEERFGREWHTEKPHIESGGLGKGLVRYVLEK